jgi:hypothetical protein
MDEREPGNPRRIGTGVDVDKTLKHTINSTVWNVRTGT